MREKEDKKPVVLLVVTMDTKGSEAAFVLQCMEERGVSVQIMDAGIRGECTQPVSISREKVARAAGTTLDAVRSIGHEGKALAVMIQGAVSAAETLDREVGIKGVFGIGGSMGTTLGTAVMRAFPVGLPKVMVSTMASRDTRAFVGTRDILMLHSVCDLSGLNRITRVVLKNGAHAMAGMVRWQTKSGQDVEKPLALISTLSTTDACSGEVRRGLEERGYEVVVFHTVGAGGEAMEECILERDVAAVVDLSLHELLDRRFGGDYDAGPKRGTTAISEGVPAVLVPGNLDFLASGAVDRARERFPGRNFHVHNAAITIIQAENQEIREIGRVVGAACSVASGPLEILVPMSGLSALDHPQGPLHNSSGPGEFLEGLEETLESPCPVKSIPAHINDPGFAAAVLEAFDRVAATGRPAQ